MLTAEQKDQIDVHLHDQFEIDGEYEIDDEGVINVHGGVIRRSEQMTRLKVRFGVITQSMQVDRCRLKSLQGFPHEVGGGVSIARTLVSSLQGAPRTVGSNFWAYGCQLKNLTGAPEHVGGKFVVHDNDLTSYDHVPTGCTYVELPYNPQIPVLRLLAYPMIQITSIGNTTSRQRASPLTKILNKYAGEGKKGALACAAELIKAGFKDNARW